MPKLSIIMPAYNAAAFVREAIDSILSQTFTDWELLVADDGSKDDTRAIIDSYTDPRIRKLHAPENQGYLRNVNRLFAETRGEYISFLDADDRCLPTRFEKQIQRMEENPALGLCGCWSRYFSASTGETTNYREGATEPEAIVKEIDTRIPFNGAAILVRRIVYETIGGYQPFFDRIGAEHVDWIHRIAEHFPIASVGEHLYEVRMTPESFSRTIKSPMQLITADVIRFLKKQRQTQHGLDGLMAGGDRAALDAYVASLLRPYELDPALMYRKESEWAMSLGHHRKAWLSAWKAIRTRPFSLINYRLAFYIFRKARLRVFRE